MLRRGLLIAAVLIAAVLALSGCGLATAVCAQAPEKAPDKPSAAAPLPSTAEYQSKLAAYTQARQKFGDEAAAYWGAVAQKRRLRNAKRRAHEEIALDDYVLTQPPVYVGPAPPSPPLPAGKDGADTPTRKYIPVVADFLKSAQEHFGFAPQRPRGELEFKRAYAKLALEAGLTKEQIVRIYVFETGGNGTYDAQAGLEYSRRGRAISPALGYNQLLNTNSVELLAERGDEFVAVLKARAAASDGEAKQALERKVDVLRRMMKFCRTVPDDWNAHDALAKKPLFRFSALQISLFLPEISLLPKIISLLIFVGNLLRSGCGTGAFASEIASKSLEIAKFPVNFPVTRELQVETGSYLTAHTTIQSYETANPGADSR